MGLLTPEVVQQVLLDSVCKCAREGDFSIPIEKVRGELRVLDLGIDSLGGNEIVGAFQDILRDRTGRTISPAEADSIVGALSEDRTLAQVAEAVCNLLNV